MAKLIQDWTPYDQSLQWQIHERYYAQRGAGAWTEGEVPWVQTNNAGLAFDTAEFLVQLAESMHADGAVSDDQPFCVLEVGGGVGHFAANVCAALHARLGPSGAALLNRLRYVFTDSSEKTVADAMRSQHLQPWVAQGVVVGARFDVRDPKPLLTGANGHALQPLSAVVASYVCDVMPCKLLQRTSNVWQEQTVRLRAGPSAPPRKPSRRPAADPAKGLALAEIDMEYGWQPFDPDGCFGDAQHAAIIARLCEGLGDVSFAYHQPFVDFLGDLRAMLHPGGVVFINDYGPTERSRICGTAELRPSVYGDSLSHGVTFDALDALAAVSSWHLQRTSDGLASLQTAVLRHATPWTPALVQAFGRIFRRRCLGEGLVDMALAARALAQQQQPTAAARFYRRALLIDPANADLMYELGEQCLEAGQPEAARLVLLQGLAMDGAGRRDFLFQIGRACAILAQPEEAIGWYTQSLAREEHPVTFVNLGILLALQGRFAESRAAFERALTLDPADTRALEGIADLPGKGGKTEDKS